MRATMLPVWIAMGLGGLISCKMKGDSAAMSPRGMDLPAMESAATAGSAAMPMKEDAGKDGAKPAENKETWKRSQIVPTRRASWLAIARSWRCARCRRT